MGGGVIGNRPGTMHENITGNLYTPGHGGVVKETGIVIGILVAGLVAARWCASVFSGTDMGLQNKSITFVSAELLGGQVNLDPFRTATPPAILLLELTGETALRFLSRE